MARRSAPPRPLTPIDRLPPAGRAALSSSSNPSCVRSLSNASSSSSLLEGAGWVLCAQRAKRNPLSSPRRAPCGGFRAMDGGCPLARGPGAADGCAPKPLAGAPNQVVGAGRRRPYLKSLEIIAHFPTCPSTSRNLVAQGAGHATRGLDHESTTARRRGAQRQEGTAGSGVDGPDGAGRRSVRREHDGRSVSACESTSAHARTHARRHRTTFASNPPADTSSSAQVRLKGVGFVDRAGPMIRGKGGVPLPPPGPSCPCSARAYSSHTASTPPAHNATGAPSRT